MGRDPSRLLSDLPHRFREQLIELRGESGSWWRQLTEDPEAILSNPLTRLIGLITLGLVVLVGGGLLIQSVTPDVAKPTPLALIHVACDRPACRHSYQTQVPIATAAADWPLICPECGQESVYRALRDADARRWYAVRPGAPAVSPFTAAETEPADTRPTGEPAPQRPTSVDDMEDGW